MFLNALDKTPPFKHGVEVHTKEIFFLLYAIARPTLTL
jgi:hypothetical protein